MLLFGAGEERHQATDTLTISRQQGPRSGLAGAGQMYSTLTAVARYPAAPYEPAALEIVDDQRQGGVRAQDRASQRRGALGTVFVQRRQGGELARRQVLFQHPGVGLSLEDAGSAS